MDTIPIIRAGNNERLCIVDLWESLELTDDPRAAQKNNTFNSDTVNSLNESGGYIYFAVKQLRPRMSLDIAQMSAHGIKFLAWKNASRTGPKVVTKLLRSFEAEPQFPFDDISNIFLSKLQKKNYQIWFYIVLRGPLLIKRAKRSKGKVPKRLSVETVDSNERVEKEKLFRFEFYSDSMAVAFRKLLEARNEIFLKSAKPAGRRATLFDANLEELDFDFYDDEEENSPIQNKRKKNWRKSLQLWRKPKVQLPPSNPRPKSARRPKRRIPNDVKPEQKPTSPKRRGRSASQNLPSRRAIHHEQNSVVAPKRPRRRKSLSSTSAAAAAPFRVNSDDPSKARAARKRDRHTVHLSRAELEAMMQQ
mmetsp:Transcript_8793/g.9771  ORF Transcript_8793/g.9771 Transcript_8793/m.9771 type:complete len:362 (-) Transcript_8793:102-1187(-)|eukprot:CAMPEP_0168515532 /NCGR_PEP_ID=MMETSP0405-20121227/4819_1 /TAXON_ID=498012 /ORGANISM="Trichosphaerium sp, Strain Am-I-7 wt" /LENGTH=361 /DNA_ID=CAMNT_0008534983 /DNA_START=1563 /DNA_END=2648 /DNA_ORIENTATION=+